MRGLADWAEEVEVSEEEKRQESEGIWLPNRPSTLERWPWGPLRGKNE